jgi:tripartite-type tricarboxylate transporter receptor subunit TctC
MIQTIANRSKTAITASVFLMCFLALSVSPVMAEGYPSKPIKLICGNKAGGSTDLAARVLVSVIPSFLGQPVVVVNKTGAGGMLAVKDVLEAKPDGYTMMEATIGFLTIRPALHRKSKYTYNTLKPIARTEIVPAVLVTRPDKRWHNYEEFVNFLKKNPKKLKYAVTAIGSISDIGIKIVMDTSDIPIKDVIGGPFGGTAPALAAVLGKHADFLYANLSPLIDHIKAGNLVALAITTNKRLKSLPDVPTFKELGYPEAAIMGWKGVLGPPDLPDDIVKIWEDAVLKSVKSKPWKKFAKKLGVKPAYLNSRDFSAFIEAEYKKFKALAEKNNLVIE